MSLRKLIAAFVAAVMCAAGTVRAWSPEPMSDEELLETVQRQTFRYFWDYAYPDNGMIRERSKGMTGEVLEPFESAFFLTPDGEKGLKGEYFNNMHFSGEPELVRVDEIIDMDWELGSPDPIINEDRFSIRWTGYIVFPEDGEYEVGLGSDDGSRLYIDETLIIDNWGDHAFQVVSGKFEAEAGKEYPLLLEYYENTGEASISLGLVHRHEPDGEIRETRTNSTVATGATGMGAMAIIVGVERDWITRQEAAERILSIVSFLEESDRYHGVFPHWLDAQTGETVKFSELDDGADTVETALLFQGLLAARAYFSEDNETENLIREKITKLWNEIEWDFFTRGENVLYWHWSPNHGWGADLHVSGWNECLILYILAAGAENHAIDPDVYHWGWARNGNMANGKEFHGIRLPLGPDYGGPLFFAHYTFLGVDPRGLSDRYADYWEQNVNHTLINRAHCIHNPNNYRGYGPQSWGLTASDSHGGYSAHSPANDLGTITPTAALASMPYTPEYSMEVLRHFYYNLGDKLWSPLGFIDAFSEHYNWYAGSHIGIDQGPIIIMIENHRTGLLWDIFMEIPEVQRGLRRLGFEGNF